MTVADQAWHEWSERAAEELSAKAELAEAAQAIEPPAATSWDERIEQMAAEWPTQAEAIETP